MKVDNRFDLDTQTRLKLWQELSETIESYITAIDQKRVAPIADVQKIRSVLKSVDFNESINPLEVLNLVNRMSSEYQVHVSHPRYFGLFNPAPTTMSIIADTLVATFNPNVAAWAHSPFAVEVEQYLIQEFGKKFGYKKDETDGTFATGGTEANLTGLLTALVHKFPKFIKKGINGLKTQPTLYVSSESHYSIERAAFMTGLGSDAVRNVPVNDSLHMDLEALDKLIQEDKTAGRTPFLIIATAGTTNAGIIDPISSISEIASQNNLWMHVDAAWGGAAIFLPELKGVLQGIEKADSITLDAHKWLSVSMSAGIFLTKHKNILNETFKVEAEYIPKDVKGLPIINPYNHSIQCSRRFIGLKVFMSLAVAGWEGYIKAIRHQVAMGNFLKQELEKNSWNVINKTELPIACFTDQSPHIKNPDIFLNTIADKIVASGKAWLSTTYLNKIIPVLRVCITNHRTTTDDIVTLVDSLEKAKREL